MFLNPRHFIMMGGIKSMSAANFAVEIIRSLNKRHDKAGENAVDLEGIKHENKTVLLCRGIRVTCS
jgi:hypothetical protein